MDERKRSEEFVQLVSRLLFGCFVVAALITMCTSDASAQKKSTSRSKSVTQLTSAEDAGVKLLALQSKGIIELQISEPSTFLLVEPLAWKGMTHRDKIQLCQTAIMFLDGLNQKQSKKIDFLIVWDMTDHSTLARGYLDENRIEILK